MKHSATEHIAALRMEGSVLQKHMRSRRTMCLAAFLWLAMTAVVVVGMTGSAWLGKDCLQKSLKTIASYEQMYQYVKQAWEEERVSWDAGIPGESTVEMAASSTNGMSAGGMSSTDVTSMNVRETGVREADFAVTNGAYIYTLTVEESEQTPRFSVPWIVIYRADGQDTDVCASFEIPTTQEDGTHVSAKQVQGELYIRGDMMVAMTDLDNETMLLSFYDISDAEHPKLLRQAAQDGEYQTCREVDGVLYLMTEVTFDDAQKAGGNAYAPKVDGEQLSCRDMIYPEEAQGAYCMLFSSWTMNGEISRVDARAVLGGFWNFYMTEENIYLYRDVYLYTTGGTEDMDEKTNRSSIVKLSHVKGKIKPVAAVDIAGSITDGFGIQEQDGRLFAVAKVSHYRYVVAETEEESDSDTSQESSFTAVRSVENTDISVYSLDDTLHCQSRLQGLAEDKEEIKAARYIGDVCYFVSYHTTDPLFCVDLSDPRKLKVLDALEMPGYSDYLHAVGDDMLLGIGKTQSGELKIALYDISDSKNLKVLDEQTVEKFEDSSAVRDYRRVFIDTKKGVVGFGVSRWTGDEENTWLERGFVFYQYSRQKKFRKYKLVSVSQDEDEDVMDEEYYCIRIGTNGYIMEAGGDFQRGANGIIMGDGQNQGLQAVIDLQGIYGE